MAIDDTSPVSLIAVGVELALSTPYSLLAAHSAADPGQFDPTYAQAGNSLYEFRNYGNVAPDGSTGLTYAVKYGDVTYQFNGLTNEEVKCHYKAYQDAPQLAHGVTMYYYGSFAVGTQSVSGVSPYGPVGLANSDVFVKGAVDIVRLPSSLVTEITPLSSVPDACYPGNGLKLDNFACWEFNDTGTSTAIDSSGLSNTGNIIGTVTQGVAGIVGTAFNFTAAGNIDIVSNAKLQALDVSVASFAVSFWIKSSSPGTSRRILEYRPGNINGYPFSFQTNSSENLLVAIYDGSTSKFGTILKAELFDGTWHHVIAIFIQNNELSLRIDNVFHSSTSVAGLNPTSRTGNYLTIGSTDSNSGRINAEIQQVAIWEGGLSTDATEALYNNGNGIPYSEWNLPPTIPQNLVATNILVTGFDLAWSASTDADGIANYIVGYLDSGSNLITYAEPIGTSVHVSGRGYSASWWVRAVDNKGGVSAHSSLVNVNQPEEPVSMITTGQSTSALACPNTDWISTRAHNGRNLFPVVGDDIYTTATSGSKFNGGGLFFRAQNESKSYEIDNKGEVLSVTNC